MEFENQTLDYFLPEDKIASFPLSVRHNSKLLVYQHNQINHDQFINLNQHLEAGNLLVFNNTKVFNARMQFYTERGTAIELFCLEPSSGNDPSLALLATNYVEWNCMVGGAKKWKSGKISCKFLHENNEVIVEATMISRKADVFHIAFDWNKPNLVFAEILHLQGELPLPPYMNRKANEEDKLRYQTVYATQNGSVAAPTAGLHFTKEVMQSLHQKKIATTFITLHVGAGTFKPIKTAHYKDHEMHEELIDVSVAAIENMINHVGKIIAVGTTSLRTIESLYWMGVKAFTNNSIGLQDISIKQWEAYELKHELNTETALISLLNWMKNNKISQLICKTQIMITPEYNLKVAIGLITNFHQPKSTLLLIIAAVTGKNWEKIYREALDHDYRFLSYGDSSLLMTN